MNKWALSIRMVNQTFHRAPQNLINHVVPKVRGWMEINSLKVSCIIILFFQKLLIVCDVIDCLGY